MQQPSFEYQIADAVLSGRPVPKAPAPVELDETRRELKVCELCGRNFTRPIGSGARECDRHSQKFKK